MNDPQQRYEAIVAKLRLSGHKITPQRMAVARILAHSNGHPNHLGGQAMPEKTFKHTCECTSCGNEAEMMVTCSLKEAPSEVVNPKDEADSAKRLHRSLHAWGTSSEAYWIAIKNSLLDGSFFNL